VPVDNDGRADESESGVCLWWVNVGGSGDENKNLN